MFYFNWQLYYFISIVIVIHGSSFLFAPSYKMRYNIIINHKIDQWSWTILIFALLQTNHLCQSSFLDHRSTHLSFQIICIVICILLVCFCNVVCWRIKAFSIKYEDKEKKNAAVSWLLTYIVRYIAYQTQSTNGPDWNTSEYSMCFKAMITNDTFFHICFDILSHLFIQ